MTWKVFKHQGREPDFSRLLARVPKVLIAGLWLAHGLCPVSGATLGYSTFFGGQDWDQAYSVAVDGQGNAYIAGSTLSTNSFPLLNPVQSSIGGDADVFICKLDSAGKLLFSTFLGGSGDDNSNAIALDKNGNILIVGQTHSTDFPVTDDAFQPDYAGGSAVGFGDGFLAKLSNDGSRLLYASYFGGTADDILNGVAVASDGSVLVTGITASDDLPIRNALQPQSGGGSNDSFVAKFDSSLTNLVFSTYLGGANDEQDSKIAVDPAGFIYVCGRTLSTDFPVTPGAFQTTHVVVTNIGDNWDAFITKLKPDGSALVYSTYLGNATDDAAFAIAADASGSAYVTGGISATWDQGTFPLGFQPRPAYGGQDAYVAKFRPDGSGLDWFTYLGGSARDIGSALALDSAGSVLVCGNTDSQDFPLSDPFQPKYGGGIWDAFVAKISADGQKLLYSSYLGGGGEDWGFSVGVDSGGNAIVVGQTTSADFPDLNAFQDHHAANMPGSTPFDAFITRITPTIQPPELRIARSGSNVLLTWPTSFVGYSLEYSAIVGGSLPASWHVATGSPLVIGDQQVIIQPASQATRAYRLYRP
jgi:hypothetical protein